MQVDIGTILSLFSSIFIGHIVTPICLLTISNTYGHIFILTFNLPDLKVISAETVPVRIFSGNQYGNHEVTYTWNRGEQKEFWLFVLRLYLSGDFELAPPDILLPPFLIKKNNEHCCSVM